MKTKVAIEETVVRGFDVDVPEGIDPYDYVRDEYYKCNIVLAPGECQFRQMQIDFLDDNTYTEWKEF